MTDEAASEVVEGAPDDAPALVLEGACGVEEVASLHQWLSGALEAHRPLTIDGEAVEQVDGAVLQLLAAFSLAAEKQGLEWRWRSPPQGVLAEGLRLLGLEGIVGAGAS